MCGVQGEHRVALGPIKNSSNNAIMSHADAPSKNQEDQGNYKRRSTKPARKGGTATPASQGTRQATTPGRAQQSHQNRLTNIFSSSRQMWQEEQENFKPDQQNRPAIHRLPPQHVRNQQTSKNTYFILLNPSNKQLRPTQMSRAGPQGLVTSKHLKGW